MFEHLRRAIFFVLALTFGCHHSALAQDKGWTIEQSNKLVGRQTIYITKDAVKIVNPRRRFVLLMKAPAWNVALYNMKSKVFYEAPLNRFESCVSLANPLLAGDYLQSLPVKKATSSKETVSSLACDHYSMQGRPKRLRKKRYGGFEVDMQDELRVTSAHYFVSNSIMVPQQISTLIERVYKIPRIEGIPVKLIMSLDTGEVLRELETDACRAGVLAKNTFDCPKNFKRVKTEQEAAIDADDSQLKMRINQFDDWRGAWERDK
jgi:hypothetical protein